MCMFTRWDTFLSTQKSEALKKLVVFFPRKHANENTAAMSNFILFD